MKNELILVFYIDVRLVEEEEIPRFMSRIGQKIVPENMVAEAILMPVMGETRVECINPKYITDGELIKKHERLMAELHEHLNNQMKNE